MSTLEEIERNCSQPDWDSYGAHPITQEALEAARSVAYVPTVGGGIQVEVMGGGWRWEFEYKADGSLDTVFVVPHDTPTLASAREERTRA